MRFNEFFDAIEKTAIDRKTVKAIGHLGAAAAAGAMTLHAIQMFKRKREWEMKKKASAWEYAKPLLIGTGLGAVGGAVTAPKGQERSWATSGAVIGGISSGPAQVLLKRVLRRGTDLKTLAREEIPHQSAADIFKWTGIGGAASAGITGAMGGYKKDAKPTRLGQFADTGIDLGEIILRSIR